MAINTIKFSEFANGGNLENSDITVGLKTGENTYFNNPWTFLPPGTTAERPDILNPVNWQRLRFNTTIDSYEYFDPTQNVWQQLEDSGDIEQILALLASHMVSEGASLIGLQNQSNVTDKTVQDLANASFIAKTDNGSLQNAQFLGDLDTGILKNTTSTGELSISPSLTSIDELTTVANQMLYTTASNTYATTSLTSAARSFLALNDVASMVTFLNVLSLAGGTMAGNISLGGAYKVTNAINPTDPQDYATKAYVDAYTPPASGPAGGDLSGTYPNPTVAKINGVALGTTTATSGNVLIGSGTAWETNSISGDGTLTSAGALTVTRATNLRNGAQYQVPYQSGVSTTTFTNVQANGILATLGTGQPIFVTTLPSTVQSNITQVGTINAGVWSGSTIGIAYGGTGVTSVTTSPTASAWAGWDSNSILSAVNFKSGYSTTATSGGNTTLTVGSNRLQYFTGSTTHTVTLPVTSTLALGQSWTITNNSTSAITVNSSGGNLVQTMAASTNLVVTCILTSGTTAASWSVDYTNNGGTGGSVTSVAMTVPSFLSITGSPITSAGTLAVSYSGTALPIANGGTGVTSVPTSASASAFAAWNSNSNLPANNFLSGYTTTATAAGTTTLTVSSTRLQYFTGSTTQTVVLPVTSTLVLGQSFEIVNNSSGVVTVNSSGSNLVQTMAASSRLTVTCILTSGTTAASWSVNYTAVDAGGTVTSVAMSVPSFLSVSGSPITTSGTLAVSYSGTPLPVANGGTGASLSATGGTSQVLRQSTVGGNVTVSQLAASDLSNGVTGSGAVVLATSPTLVSPALGTPSSGNLANCVGYPAASISGVLPIINGGTAVSSVPTSATASAFAAWNSNSNLPANAFLSGYTTTATAAGTTTLTVSSTQQQYFTGSTTQTVVLPVTSTLVLGQKFEIVNNSSGVVTVNSSGGNLVQSMAASSRLTVTCILTSGTTAASWSANYTAVDAGGTVTSVGMTVPAFLSVSGSPVTTSGTLAVSYSGTALPVANGGTNRTSLPTSATASSYAAWNSNSNLPLVNYLPGFSTTATAAGTTTLVVGSNRLQYFTGTTTQTIVLPVASTLVTGQQFEIVNSSTGNLTVNSSGGNLVQTMIPSSRAIVTCILASGTDASSWSVFYSSPSGRESSWSTITSNTTATTNTGYIMNGSSSITLTLPSSANIGDTVKFAGKGAGGYVIDGGGSSIIISPTTTTSIASTNRYDSGKLTNVGPYLWQFIEAPQTQGYTYTAFTPLTLSGCVCWQDATQESLGALATFSDLSGNSNNATQGTGANQPVNTANTINGLNALVFDGVNSIMEYGTKSFLCFPSTIFAVANVTDLSVSRNIIGGSVTSGGPPGSVRINVQSGGLGQFFTWCSPTTPQATTITPAQTVSVPYIYGGYCDGVTGNSLAGFRSTITPLTSTLSGTYTLAAFNTNLGGSRANGISALQGYIGEIIVYNRVLTTTERTQVMAYLSTKWGITVS